MKIAFIHNAYTSYRIKFFNKLTEHNNIEFFFHKIYDTSSERPLFKYKILYMQTLPLLPKDFTFSPFLFFHLLKNKYNLFIGAGSGYIDTITTFFIAKLLRKPFVLWDVSWFYNRSFLKLMAYPIFRYISLKSNSLVLPGKKSKEFYIKIGVNVNKIFLSPNVIDFDLDDLLFLNEKEKEFRNKLGIRNDEKIVLYFGRLVPQKGLEYLINAFLSLNLEGVKLLLVTTFNYDFHYFDKLKSLSNGSNNVIFYKIHTKEKALCFKISNIFVLPSITTKNGPEIWGMVLNEAMAMGKPVITTTAVGAAYDLVRNGENGYIVKEKDSKELANSINTIINNEFIEKLYGENSLHIIKKYNYDYAVNGFINAIYKAVGDSY
jgi:glycosyltransferase involved in cell wall biosynthesis